jgi:hypothetical protein
MTQKMRDGSWPWLCPQRILMTNPADQWAQLRVDLRRFRNAKTGKIPVCGAKAGQIACVLGG